MYLHDLQIYFLKLQFPLLTKGSVGLFLYTGKLNNLFSYLNYFMFLKHSDRGKQIPLNPPLLKGEKASG